MEFEYIIENNEVTITGHKNKLATEISIPEFIEGYPVVSFNWSIFKGHQRFMDFTIPNTVKYINSSSFEYLYPKTINGYGLTMGELLIINNKFVINYIWFYTIVNKICDDYVLKIGHKYYLLIAPKLYDRYFNHAIEIKYGI